MLLRNLFCRKKRLFAAALVCALVLPFFFCKKASKELIYIWTDQSEFALYAELFNISQDKYRAVVVYREDPARFLPPVDETPPDIVVSAWLKNERTRKNFMQLDYLFDEFKLSRTIFYPQLLELGNINERQYLLPVSFNLPAVIFDSKNASLIDDSLMLSLEQIRDLGAKYNKKSRDGQYTAMGFAPRWDNDFLYVVSKLKGADYHETKNVFGWNAPALANSVQYLKEWTAQANTSPQAEEDFKFKYLYNPVYKSVTSDRCLFGYMKTEQLFNLPPDKLQNIDFRWIHDNNVIQMNDQIISLGVYRRANNLEGVQAFILWFMNESSQKDMISWILSMHLASSSFGISGGFSAIKSVNERVFPAFYPLLFGHLPAAESLRTPQILPARWLTVKEKVVIPYLLDAVSADAGEEVKSLESRLAEWNRQNN